MSQHNVDVRMLERGPRLFWENDGAHIQRLSGRAMFGDATDYNGKLPLTGDTTWMSELRTASVEAAQVGSVSTIGHSGLFGASRSSDNGVDGSMGTMGLYGMAYNDHVGRASAYGYYIEAWREPGTGITHGGEIDIINRGGLFSSYPYRPNSPSIGESVTEGLRIASGGEDPSAQTASVALSIINNGARFEKGILFDENSLSSDIAMALGQSHEIAWYYSGTGTAARIDASDGMHLYDAGGVERGHIGFSPTFGGILIDGKGQAMTLIGQTLTPAAGALVQYMVLRVNGTAVKIPLYAT